MSHVLVAVDDSEASRDAFEHALAEFPDARITALHVFESSHPFIYADATGGSAEQYDAFERENREHGTDLLEEVAEFAAAGGRDQEVKTALEDGEPAREIVDYAAAHDVDHLVVGTRGRNGASRVLLGSVATSVAKRAPVPVTIVR